MSVVVDPKKIFTLLLVIIFFLLFMNVAGIVGTYIFSLEEYGLFDIFNKLFNFNVEKNIPTFYSTITIFGSSIILLIITLKQKSINSDYMHWLALTLIFLFLSFDEFIEFHERLTDVTRELLNTSGLFYYAWIIPYSVMLTIFLGVYLPFLLKLPKKIMILFILSGITFITGAIGFEMFGGFCAEKYGHNLIYAVFYTFEELFEMLGIALFIYALLSCINDKFDNLTIVIKKTTEAKKKF